MRDDVPIRDLTDEAEKLKRTFDGLALLISFEVRLITVWHDASFENQVRVLLQSGGRAFVFICVECLSCGEPKFLIEPTRDMLITRALWREFKTMREGFASDYKAYVEKRDRDKTIPKTKKPKRDDAQNTLDNRHA